VAPQADHLSGDARSRAMKGIPILEKATVFPSLADALTPFDYVIATSARLSSPKKLTRSVFSPAELATQYAVSDTKLALVFGAEKSGLSNKDIRLCDGLVHIPTFNQYQSLNLGHAVAILLYELYAAPHGKHKIPVSGETKEKLVELFSQMALSAPGYRNPVAAQTAFRTWLAKSPLSNREAKTILAVFDKTLKAKRNT